MWVSVKAYLWVRLPLRILVTPRIPQLIFITWGLAQHDDVLFLGQMLLLILILVSASRRGHGIRLSLS